MITAGKTLPLFLTKEWVGGKRLEPFLLIFMNIKLIDQLRLSEQMRVTVSVE